MLLPMLLHFVEDDPHERGSCIVYVFEFQNALSSIPARLLRSESYTDHMLYVESVPMTFKDVGSTTKPLAIAITSVALFVIKLG